MEKRTGGARMTLPVTMKIFLRLRLTEVLSQYRAY
jgi:hypothetical protein